MLDVVRGGEHKPRGIADLLRCPVTGGPLVLSGEAYVSSGAPEVRFPIEDGIVRAFLSHDGPPGDVTVDMQNFYSANPFPNYDEMETVGSLIEKSLARDSPRC